MTLRRLLPALLAGLFLATLPFWRYIPWSGTAEPHSDHEPRYGGQLGMVGDHHIEVRRRRGNVEVFVSDARRRPLQPLAGWAVFDRGERVPLAWDRYRLIGPDRPTATGIEAIASLADGTTLALTFDFATEGSPD